MTNSSLYDTIADRNYLTWKSISTSTTTISTADYLKPFCKACGDTTSYDGWKLFNYRKPQYKYKFRDNCYSEFTWNIKSDSDTWTCYNYGTEDFVQQTPEERIKQLLRDRSQVHIAIRHKAVGHATDVREQRARETLRLVIGDDHYERYLRKGFVSVQNPISGRIYQIHPGHQMTVVYERGLPIQKLCVVLRGDFPPTDSVIVRYLMALNNEDQLWTLANKFAPPVRTVSRTPVQPTIALTDALRAFRGERGYSHLTPQLTLAP